MTRFIRLENLALGLAAIAAYYLTGGSWVLFAILFLAPDISFVGYLAGPKVGALCYNAVHTWIGPVAALALAQLLPDLPLIEIALIWAAHIGIDRALGYGLKHQSSAKDTHLGRIGGKHG